MYCSVLSLGGNVTTRRMSKPDMGSIFHIKKSMKYSGHYQNYQNLMLLTSSDTKRTLMHLFLFTNSAQRELVLIHVRRVYATAINFPCITTLPRTRDESNFVKSIISSAISGNFSYWTRHKILLIWFIDSKTGTLQNFNTGKLQNFKTL